MAEIAVKRPYSSLESDYSKSRTIADISIEFEMSFLTRNLNMGILMITQVSSGNDEPNFVYEGEMIKGRVYFVKGLKNRIGNLTEADMEYLRDLTSQSMEFDW